MGIRFTIVNICQTLMMTIILCVVMLVLSLASFSYAQETSMIDTPPNTVVPIIFETSPKGASIKLDNAGHEFLCPHTPCTLELPIDEILILTVSKQGYLTKRSGERYRPVAIGQSIHSIALTPESSTNSPADRFELYTYEKQGLCRVTARNADKINQDATPCYRIPGIMPPRAERSGTCSFRYDVTKAGTVQNIEILSCSEEMFARPTLSAIMKWQYVPAVRKGVTMATVGVEASMTYHLRDERGDVILILDAK